MAKAEKSAVTPITPSPSAKMRFLPKRSPSQPHGAAHSNCKIRNANDTSRATLLASIPPSPAAARNGKVEIISGQPLRPISSRMNKVRNGAAALMPNWYRNFTPSSFVASRWVRNRSRTYWTSAAGERRCGVALVSLGSCGNSRGSRTPSATVPKPATSPSATTSHTRKGCFVHRKMASMSSVHCPRKPPNCAQPLLRPRCSGEVTSTSRA